MRVVAVMATPEPLAFVVPSERHPGFFTRLSMDKNNNRKFHITKRGDRFLMLGRGERIELDGYLNRFDLFGAGA